MKKLLGISLVAILAATPLMAMADPVGTGETPATETGTAVTATGDAPFALIGANAATDGNAATAGYVKGAYNAAIKAVNTVAEAKQDALTAGAGVDITGDTISVDLKSGGGLTTTDDELEVVVDGTTVVKGANGLEVGEITTADVASTAKAMGVAQGATNDKLTTKDYVDEAVAGINTNITNSLATKTEVTANIDAATGSVTLENGSGLTVTGTPTGTIANTFAPGSVTIALMDDWSNPNTPGTGVTANVTGASITSAFTGTGITDGDAHGTISDINITAPTYVED